MLKMHHVLIMLQKEATSFAAGGRNVWATIATVTLKEEI